MQTYRMIHFQRVHGRCIVSGEGEPGDETGACHARLQRSVGGNDAVVTRHRETDSFCEALLITEECGAMCLLCVGVN